jgi:hypothetical protein
MFFCVYKAKGRKITADKEKVSRGRVAGKGCGSAKIIKEQGGGKEQGSQVIRSRAGEVFVAGHSEGMKIPENPIKRHPSPKQYK